MGESSPSALKFYELTESARKIVNDANRIRVQEPIELKEFKSYVKRFYSPGSPYICDLNPLYLSIEAKTIADLGGRASSMVPSMTTLSANTASLSDRKQIPILSNELSEFETKASQISAQYEKDVSEQHIGSEIARHISAVNHSQVISSELQAVGEELTKKKTNKIKIKNILSSIANRIKRGVLNLPGMIKGSLDNLYSSAKTMINTVGTAVREKLYELLRKISEVLSGFMSQLIGAFFSLLALIQKIAADKGFKIEKVNLEIEAFELQVFMARPLPLIYPKLKTPKLSADFSPK